MSHGLRVWDASGNLVLDVQERISRIHGVYTVPNVSIPANGSYLFPVTGMVDDGTWFVTIPEDEIWKLYAAPFGFNVSTGGILISAPSGKSTSTFVNNKFLVFRG